MASQSTKPIHLAYPEPCSNCGHSHADQADNADSAASGPAAASTSKFAIYVANLLLIGGAVAISVLPRSASSPLAFAGFFIGHVCFSMHAIRLRDRGLLFLNAALAILDFYAVIIRL